MAATVQQRYGLDNLNQRVNDIRAQGLPVNGVNRTVNVNVERPNHTNLWAWFLVPAIAAFIILLLIRPAGIQVPTGAGTTTINWGTLILWSLFIGLLGLLIGWLISNATRQV